MWDILNLDHLQTDNHPQQTPHNTHELTCTLTFQFHSVYLTHICVVVHCGTRHKVFYLFDFRLVFSQSYFQKLFMSGE